MTGVPQGDSPSAARHSSYTYHGRDRRCRKGGAEGMIVTSGGRFAGYGFYLLKGKPVFTWNMLNLERVQWKGDEALTPGQAYSRIRLQI